jgi:hypothetical protein
MRLLESHADDAVRQAVDAFMTGALRPAILGRTICETRNSRYLMVDGIVAAATDESIVGAELVGWLLEQPEQSRVDSTWTPRARGILVDRSRGRHIIITSSTRSFKVVASGSQPPPSYQASKPTFIEPAAARHDDDHAPPTPRRIPPCPPPPPMGPLFGNPPAMRPTTLPGPMFAGAAADLGPAFPRALPPVNPPPRHPAPGGRPLSAPPSGPVGPHSALPMPPTRGRLPQPEKSVPRVLISPQAR